MEPGGRVQNIEIKRSLWEILSGGLQNKYSSIYGPPLKTELYILIIHGS